jgi:2-polyprenyl-6-hydroxyphenyl methylase/3-demethylubiquinone-9 3-methyltransferase
MVMSATDTATTNSSVIDQAETVSFSFGRNWKKYVSDLDESNVREAINSFRDFTGFADLKGESFLDLGCGSGLNSIVALRLGARRVVSIDLDENSVQCATRLRDRLAPDAQSWTIAQGSVLDTDFLRKLGQFSYVYCWGVVHHTGAMWQAVQNITGCVEPGGKLHLAIYNEHRNSRRWLQIKRLCNRHPRTIFPVLKLALAAYVCGHLLYEGQSPLKYLREYGKKRGMKFWRDIEDWLGGLPYEYCKPDRVVEALSDAGFAVERLNTTTFIGCNEFLFRANAVDRVTAQDG